jgi:hypothetical protein
MLMRERGLLPESEPDCNFVKEGSPTMRLKFLLCFVMVVSLAVPAFCRETATFRGNSRHTGVYGFGDLAHRSISPVGFRYNRVDLRNGGMRA